MESGEASGSLSASGFFPVPFDCSLKDELSSTNISQRSHWQIEEGLRKGAPAVATIIAILFLFSVVLNCFVIIFCGSSKDKHYQLSIRGLTELIASITLLFNIVTQSAREFVFGTSDVVRCNVCAFTGFMVVFLFFASVFVINVRTVQLVLLLDVVFVRRKKVLISTVITAVASWIGAFTVAVLPFLGFGEYEFDRYLGMCVPRLTGKTLNRYYLVFLVVVYVIQTIVSVAHAVRLCYILSRHRNDRTQRLRNVPTQRHSRIFCRDDDEDKTRWKRFVPKYKFARSIIWIFFTALNSIKLLLIFLYAVSLSGVANTTPGFYHFVLLYYCSNPVLEITGNILFIKLYKNRLKDATKLRKLLQWRSTNFRTVTAMIEANTLLTTYKLNEQDSTSF